MGEEGPTWSERIRTELGGWGFAIGLLVLTRTAVASPFVVPTGSMVPTVEVGDRIVVQKYAYGLQVPWIEPDAGFAISAMSSREVLAWAEPQRGDVVLFRHPDHPEDADWLKRVVAVPGDRVSVRDGVPRVNGHRAERVRVGRHDFLDQHCGVTRAVAWREDDAARAHPVLDSVRRGPDMAEVTVPPGQLFVMGDNRDHSADSRMWGFLPRARVRGRAVARISGGSCGRDPWVGWRGL